MDTRDGDGADGAAGSGLVNLFFDAFAWILDPANWEGRGSIPQRIGEQL